MTESIRKSLVGAPAQDYAKLCEYLYSKVTHDLSQADPPPEKQHQIVQQQISSVLDVIVQVSRMRDGTRRLTAITEVAGMEGDMITMSDIFKFNQTGVGAEGKILGYIKPTGIRPLFGPRLEAAGFKLGADVFGATAADILAARQRR